MTVVRWLHLVAMAFFVGGQLVLVAVTPVLRDDAVRMRAVAKRFGIGSGVALLTLIATGAAMASHEGLWSDGTLRLKLALLVLVFVLTGLHVRTNRTRAVSYALVVVSLAIVYCGVRLSGR